MAILVAALAAQLLSIPDPTPPPVLQPWVDYAKRVTAPVADCPPDRACVYMQRAALGGRPTEGRLRLVLDGVNLARHEQRHLLVRPASAFSVTQARFREGRGSVVLEEGSWWLRVSPGRFALEVTLGFEPAASIPLELGGPFAAVVDELETGSLAFDGTSDLHAGVMVVQAAAKAESRAQAVSVRTVRQLNYGSVVTFAYDYVISGLRGQTRLELPRLGEESIESVEPDIPFTATPTAVVVTLTPGRERLRVSGHFPARPASLAKPKVLPFEYWLLDVDPRHPVEVRTDALEVNPSDVPGAAPSPRSRGFLLVEDQALHAQPLQVTVERGQAGSGTARVRYAQGEPDRWVGTLDVTSTTRPEEDRIEVPTPAPPHYAQVGSEAVRMYGDDGTLSLRAVSPTGVLQPIRVQWRETLSTNPLLSLLRVALPAQSIHLDEQSVELSLLPGYVPIAVLGAQHTSGDLLDGLHIYAVLLAALAAALTRAARFPTWAVAIAAVLFAGLYSVGGFPRLELMLLVVGCAVLVRAPASLLVSFRQHRRLHTLVGLAWLAVLLAALLPSIFYAQERLLAALHPWSQGAELAPDRSVSSILQEAAAPSEISQDERMKSEADMEAPTAKQMAPEGRAGSSYPSAYGGKHPYAQVIRPVAFEGSSLPVTWLRYSLGSVLPGEQAGATLIVAGPVLRATWLFAECAALGVLLALLVVRARRFWIREGGAV